MTKAAWWHLYKLIVPSGVLAVALYFEGWDSWLVHFWLYGLIAFSFVYQILALLVLSQPSHRHSGRCHICHVKPGIEGWR